ncbi:MAG TPA: hypothetical protein VHH34_00600, partial [Pseudonocardiaceae bacterium]|nr:hypothetical protein [Pseudonocardiaceae bacterium]
DGLGRAAVDGEHMVAQPGIDGGQVTSAPVGEGVVAVVGEQARPAQPRPAGVLVDGDRVAEAT